MSVHKGKLNWCLAKKTRMEKIKPNEKLSEELLNNAKKVVEKVEIALIEL